METSTLNRPVLTLNKSWAAFGTMPVKDAIVLMMRGSADALCTVTFMRYSWDQWIADTTNLPEVPYYIRTPNVSIPAPQVVIMNNYADIHRKMVRYSKTAIHRRDKYTCQYCLKKQKLSDLTVDHIHPQSKGGVTSWENCVSACKTCNGKKDSRTLAQAGLTLIKTPKRPRWNPIISIREESRPDAWKPLLKETW